MAIRRKSQNVIAWEGHEIDYELVRRSRVTKNIHLELAGDGGLRVVAPARMSTRAVRRTLLSRPQAVMDFLTRARENQRNVPRFCYRTGERHLYLGGWHPLELRVTAGTRPVARFDGTRIALRLRSQAPGRVLEALRLWYRERALEHFSERLEHFSRAAAWTGGQVPPMRLRRMKRTTGSCSKSGLITLNPHLVKAPPLLIDYVVAHEICHLEEHNHGPGFYRLLEGLYPEWRAARARLRRDWQVFRAE